jgi:hypothetical protein
MQQERAGTGSSGPGSTSGSGTSTQPTAPIGSPTGTSGASSAVGGAR